MVRRVENEERALEELVRLGKVEVELKTKQRSTVSCCNRLWRGERD